MDEIAQAANKARSSRGSKFESKLSELFEVMKDEGKIKDFKRNPKIFDGEFKPDFILEKNDEYINLLDMYKYLN